MVTLEKEAFYEEEIYQAMATTIFNEKDFSCNISNFQLDVKLEFLVCVVLKARMITAPTLGKQFCLIFSSLVFYITSKTAFTRCRHSLKTVKNVTDRPSVHMKTAHSFAGTF